MKLSVSLFLASLGISAAQFRGDQVSVSTESSFTVSDGSSVTFSDGNRKRNQNRCKDLPLLCPTSPGVRSFTGIENVNAEIDAELLRISGPANYPDGLGEGLSMFTEPNARTISNIVATSPPGLKRATVTDIFWQWGQFMDHDIGLTEGVAEPFSIISEGCETTDVICVINMNRALSHEGEGGVREQLNEITGFLDASMVYGHTDERAAFLRTFTDGLMKTGENDLLPDGFGSGFANALPGGLGFIERDLFIGGDIRVNEQIGLLAMHTLWVREHNRIAGLLNEAYPGSTDEDIYQMARKLVTAEIQAITYKEFLPELIGQFAPNVNAAKFDKRVNPGVAQEFSTVAFRVGHTFLSENLLLHDGIQETGSINLIDAFFDPGMARADPSVIEEVLIGQANQAANRADIFVIEEVRTNLFGAPISGEGRDLVAFNVQRGRDHGLVRYNEMRAGYGLKRKTSFSDVSSDPEVVKRLTAAYGGEVDLCDPWICGLAEDTAKKGGQLGEMFSAIIGDQFLRFMNGDKFFYTFDPDVHNKFMIKITGIDVSSVTLADVINWNTIGGVSDPVMVDRFSSSFSFSSSDGK